ncbi:hypothetical protein BDW22DRAFT_1379748 [Trametopsis cervina]|nr:hypothetical protein BDW22DRAFT_1379748 [Trametopsis cervina]
MKRTAEKQLTRDEFGEDEEADDGEVGTGFRKADPSALATREIRGLPRRARVTAAAAAPPLPALSVSAALETEAPAVPKFAGFGGFGAPSTTTTPFSFSASQNPFAPSSSATNPFAQTTPPASSSTPSSFSPAPSVSSSASNATKLFASLVNSSTSSETTPKSSPRDDADAERVKHETQYYTGLRGLNVAFLAACKKAVDADPFMDIGEVLKRYDALRSGLKAEYEKGIQKVSSTSVLPKAPSPPSAFPGFGAPSLNKASSEPKTAPIAMPVAPSSFSGFSFSAPASTLTPSGEGFKPQLASTPSSTKPFAFGFNSDKPKEEPESISSSGSVKSAFSFGAPSSASSNSFSFGGSTNNFGGSAMSSGSGGAFEKPSSAFSGNPFSAPSDGPKSNDTTKPKEEPSAASAFGSTVFGGPSSDKPASDASTPFSFGSSSPRPSLFGTFGKSSSGSIGNPVGFGFGSPPRTPDVGVTSGVTPSGFAFGAPKATEATDDNGDGGDGASGQATADDAPPVLVTTSVHDQDGEGEEDEETTYEQKCKVYKMTEKDDGSKEWKDLGIGLLKVKVHKESNARRLLLRNSSTGKILINFNVHAGLNPSAAKNIVSLMGHEDGASVPYKLRVKTNDLAEEVKKTLDREVEKVKAKS